MTRSEPNPEFFGPYRIVRSLGIGAYSEIFLVEKQGRESALKRNKPHYRYDRTVYQTLDQEAEVLRRLKGCPFFPGYIDSGVIDDCHFLEMEYIEGLSLFHLVEKKAAVFLLGPCLRLYRIPEPYAAALGRSFTGGSLPAKNPSCMAI